MTATSERRPQPIRDVPGIVYDPVRHRARIAGTGLEVWEVVNSYRSVAYSWARLRNAFDWQSNEQLRAALTFANLNHEFVTAEIAENDAVEDAFFGRIPQLPDLPATYEIPPR